MAVEAQGAQAFARGLDEILVVEEKRQILEYAIKEELYNWPDGQRPRVFGKFDEKDGAGGEWSVPMATGCCPRITSYRRDHREGDRDAPGEIRAAVRCARADRRAHRGDRSEGDRARQAARERRTQAVVLLGLPAQHVDDRAGRLARDRGHRLPLYDGLDGPQHEHVQPDGRRRRAVDRPGAVHRRKARIREPRRRHLLHSGLLAIRAAIASKANITYKILYNDAVAMTGGQPVDGVLTVPQITHQLAAEGAKRIVIVTDEPRKYDGHTSQLAPGVTIHHRDQLDDVQRTLREIEGTTILIYDQTCATEKRRRRKRGAYPDPAKRVVINEAVCEGCGDCSVQSNCLSVEPRETEFGTKRQINQSTCNKDFRA
ncbi:hypothetical protein [Burkholderia mallei]|uniref:hypothetical protein n=1 Tax=Burkholderia mallei TaxID=13373 RepID=UPI001F5BD4F7|nr:hypothetical protein [Burkholderia mallei]